MLNNIFREIKRAKSVVILTHSNPDGDGISCCLAMEIFLNGKADVIIPTYPETYSFLPHSDRIKKSSDKEYEVAIAFDCATRKRLVGYEEYFKKAKRTIAIDHHNGNENFADFNYVFPEAPACSQILATIFRNRDDCIGVEIATCLLAGIISDTSGLSERNVTKKTFDIVSYLYDKGGNYKEVYSRIMNSYTKEQFKLKQLVVSRVSIVGDIAMSYLKKEEITNVEMVDHKSLVREYQHISNVKVSILFIEYDDFVKVSLRSSEIDVLEICKNFDGGGHKNSAGCTIYDTLENADEKILSMLV